MQQSGLDYMNALDRRRYAAHLRTVSAKRETWSWCLKTSGNWWTRRNERAGGCRSCPGAILCFEHNIHEIPLAMEKARELGVDEFNAEPAWDISWDDPEIRPAQVEPVRVNFSPDSRAAVAGIGIRFRIDCQCTGFELEFDQRWVDKAGEGPQVESRRDWPNLRVPVQEHHDGCGRPHLSLLLLPFREEGSDVRAVRGTNGRRRVQLRQAPKVETRVRGSASVPGGP